MHKPTSLVIAINCKVKDFSKSYNILASKLQEVAFWDIVGIVAKMCSTIRRLLRAMALFIMPKTFIMHAIIGAIHDTLRQ